MLTTPWLFWAGAAAVLSPIIIHLLNKRRFRRIDWGAMEFLLEAQRINRRRVKIEELILLALRCLAMLLLGLLLARPFLSSGPASLLGKAETERVIILDDSLSMNASAAGSTALAQAREALARMIEGSAAESRGDSLTLFLASDPRRPKLNGLPLGEAGAGEALAEVRAAEASDRSADLGAALSAAADFLRDRPPASNRAVYVLTDLRSRDWSAPAAGEALRKLAENNGGVQVIDFGSAAEENVAVEAIRAQGKALIAGSSAEFEISVRNFGRQAAPGVGVKLFAGDSLPLEAAVGDIAPGGTGVASFTVPFPAAEGEGVPAADPLRLRAEISSAAEDALAEDNERFYPARLLTSLRVLIVDGDPAGALGQPESFFLQRALQPAGPIKSGVAVDVVDEGEFEVADLGAYDAVIVANLYRLGDARLASLEQWVKAGGGVAFALGDQIDEELYNDQVFRGGEGLLPARLGGVDGDESEATWVGIELAQPPPPLLAAFAGENAPLIEGVKVFRWWNASLPAAGGADDAAARALAVFSNGERGPAIAEKPFGDGRSLAVFTPLDADWSNWPQEGAGFLVFAQELARHLARPNAGLGIAAPGDPLAHRISLTEFRAEAQVATPAGTTAAAQAQPPAAEGSAEGWEFRFDDTGARGFYALNLERADGSGVAPILFAANIDPAEGDLRRIERDAVAALAPGSGVRVVGGEDAFAKSAAPIIKSELWMAVLIALIAVLCAELIFGWWVGAKR